MDYGKFAGDGRQTVMSAVMLPGIMPLAMSKANARRSIDHFESRGRSTHSAMGGTVWVIWEHCVHNQIEFRLHVRPGFGFIIEKVKSDGQVQVL